MGRWVRCYRRIILQKKISVESGLRIFIYHDLLSLTQPEAIAEVHRKYFEAGADIVETNTFSGTTIAMADYEMEDIVYDLNYESARIAKEVAMAFTEKEPHKMTLGLEL